MQNFPKQVEALFSQKQKTFSGFFLAILKCAQSLKPLETKDEYPSLVISEIINSKRGGYLNVKKVLLQNTIR